LIVWDLIGALCLVAPFLLLWGWIRYFRLASRSDWRTRATVVGLSAPIVSMVVWFFTAMPAGAKGWNTLDQPMRTLIKLGFWIPALGMLIALLGRPRFLLVVVPVSIAAMLFWIGSTLP
jgi:hypothetical protein